MDDDAGMTGRWRVTATSPLKNLDFDVDVRDEGGTVAATVRHRDETVRVDGVEVVPERDGYRAKWTQQLTSPVRVSVKIDLLAVGDRLTGTAKAGLLPRMTVEGHRVR